MANSVTARFNDDCKVFVSMSDDTTVEKAVIIDADGNETDIGGGGGGSSDFTTAEVTVINNSSDNIQLENFAFVYTDHDDDPIASLLVVNANSTLIVNAVFYKNNPSSGVLHNYDSGDYSLNFSGNIEDDGDGYFIINSAGTITVEEAIQ